MSYPTTPPWEFRKLKSLHPGVPAIDLAEGLDMPTASAGSSTRPVVCLVCGGIGVRSEAQHGAEPRDCHVCDGSGEIGGGQ